MHLQHCWAVLHCLWRDTCNHRGTNPRNPAHWHSHLQGQVRELWQGHFPLTPIHTEILEKVWLSLRDGVKTNVVTLSVVMTGLKLAFAVAHTTPSRGRRWDAEQSMLSVEQGTRFLLVYTPLFPCTLPPDLVLWRSEDLRSSHTTGRRQTCSSQVRECRLSLLGPQGAHVCASPWGNTPQPWQGRHRDKQRHTCNVIQKKEIPKRPCGHRHCQKK